MTLFIICTCIAVIAVLAGLIIKKFSDSTNSPLQITWTEFAIGAAVISLVVSPLSTYTGYRMAKQDRAVYEQMLNGHEVSADVTATPCTRDGPCHWEYDCDPYIVMVPYTYTCGKSTCTGMRPETRYHDCPYVTTEYRYDVGTTLGGFNFAWARMPENADNHRWRAGKEVPIYIQNQAGTGIPRDWYEVKKRLTAGLPGPVTKFATYDNYILASNKTVLRQWSKEAERLDSLKVLPPLTTDIIGYYDAMKVGAKYVNAPGWASRVNYLNSVAGPQLNADVRVVVVRLGKTPVSPDAYSNALLAHWQNEKKWGRKALPKNVMVFVLGSDDGHTISWARAATGMPLGNESIIAEARTAFTGKPVDVDSIVGNTHWETQGGLHAVHGNGVMESLVFGLKNPDTKFQRISMSTFMYLKGEIQPTTAGWVWTGIVTFVACLLVWVLFLFIGAPRYQAWRGYSSYSYR